jgi:hypothetical protein
VAEAIRIMYTRDNILNSKCEYLNNCIPRLTIEENVYERKKRERLEEEEEKTNKESFEEFKNNKACSISTHEEQKSETSELDPPIRVLKSRKKLMTFSIPGQTRDNAYPEIWRLLMAQLRQKRFLEVIWSRYRGGLATIMV